MNLYIYIYVNEKMIQQNDCYKIMEFQVAAIIY
jgi:hypothetical protein